MREKWQAARAWDPDDAGSVALSHNWRSLLRAQLASNPHPLKQETQQDPNASYFNFPSMIFTCLDGKAECFADPERVSTESFDSREQDYWMYEPGMLPTQTLATQLGCHTAFEQDGGKFKADIEALKEETVNSVVYRQRGSDGFPQVKFSVIDSDVVRGMTDSFLYYAGDKERTYLPFVPRQLHKCSLCHLYTGYFAKTHRVDECKLLNDANEERHMRYKLDGDTTPQDRYGTGFSPRRASTCPRQSGSGSSLRSTRRRSSASGSGTWTRPTPMRLRAGWTSSGFWGST